MLELQGVYRLLPMRLTASAMQRIIQEEEILAALQPVQDPELRRSLVEMGMIRNIDIQGGNISFTLVLTTPACPLRELIVEDCKKAVATLDGVQMVTVEVTAETPRAKGLPDRQGIPGVKNIIAVSSGKGGVGKTTVSVNIAVCLAQAGAQVGILDADIYGPNVPLMLGLQGQRMVVRDNPAGNEIYEPLFNYGVKVASMGFWIGEDQPLIWRGPMLNSAIRQFLYQVEWGELDYLVIDLPPGTGDAQLTLCQAVPLAGAVIVTTPQTVALLDARKGLRMFQQLGVPVLGIVENMSYFIPPDAPEKRYDIFGSGGGERTASELGLPLLGLLPLEMPVREGGDRGVPISMARPDSASAQAFRKLAQIIAGRVSVAALA